MCLKVALPRRGSGEFPRLPAGLEETEGSDDDDDGASACKSTTSVLSTAGYMREQRELEAMVTALTHVVSGDPMQPPPGLPLSSSPSEASAASPSWGGQKRGREKEGEQLAESLMRYYRAIGDSSSTHAGTIHYTYSTESLLC